MGADSLIGAVFFGVLGVAAVVFGIGLADAVYQVVTGKPSFLPLERVVRKRTPATQTDCVIQGASKGFLVLGLVLGLGPGALAATIDVLILPSAPPPLASLPQPVFVLLMAALVTAFASGVICVGISLALALRVKYVPVPDAAVTT